MQSRMKASAELIQRACFGNISQLVESGMFRGGGGIKAGYS